MNAAARLVHQRVLSRHLMLTHFLSRQQLGLVALGVAIVVSALSLIYVTHLTRVLHAAYQHGLVEEDALQVQYGQLLLERSTQMAQSRIQHLAENKLNMVIPDHKSVVMIHE